MLEGLIERRAEYLENCNKSLGTLSQTGEPPVVCSNLHHPDDYCFVCLFFYFWHVFKLQEFTVRERLTCLCAGRTRRLGTYLCPVLLTFHGSVKVRFLLKYFLLHYFWKTYSNFLDGCDGRRKHARQCLVWSSADDSRRAHRECLGTGKWRERQNSSEPWRDDSECKEDHYFKDKVIHHYWQNKVAVSQPHFGCFPKTGWRSVFFQRLCQWGGSSFLPVFLVCAGRGNASAGSPQTHLHYWLFLVAVLAHGGHSGDGPVEVSQVLLLFIFIYLILTSVMEVCLPRGSSLVRKVSVSLASLATVNGCSVTTYGIIKSSKYLHTFSFPLRCRSNASQAAQGSMPWYIPPVSAYQEAALHQELHPHESVCVIHPESHGCHFEGNYIAYYVFQPAQGWSWMEILLQICGTDLVIC